MIYFVASIFPSSEMEAWKSQSKFDFCPMDSKEQGLQNIEVMANLAKEDGGLRVEEIDIDDPKSKFDKYAIFILGKKVVGVMILCHI